MFLVSPHYDSTGKKAHALISRYFFSYLVAHSSKFYLAVFKYKVTVECIATYEAGNTRIFNVMRVPCV
jgi:hypothetical protein